MNSTINLGSGVTEVSLLAAALVLAYGLWAGQRPLGFQAMWRVLGTLAVTQLLSLAAFPLLLGGGPWAGGLFNWRMALLSLLSLALSFLPLLVAALEANYIREVAQRQRPAAHPPQSGRQDGRPDSYLSPPGFYLD